MEEGDVEKGRYIEDLSPGDVLAGDVFVVSELEEVNAGRCRFLSLVLSDASGRRKATCWHLEPPVPFLLSQARLIRVYGLVQTAEKYRGQIKVEEFQAVAEPNDLTPYLPPLPADKKLHQKRFSTLLRSVREPHLSQLLHTIFDPETPTWARFRVAVAAQGKHHAYPGGLLEHSAEVAELCDRACTVLPGLQRDFLVTCALLHDIGKLEEMEHGLGVGRYTESGTLVGHVFSGAYRIRSAADTIAGFPEVLKDALVHMVLSHHGRPEFGAARVPARSEAHVLSECDLLSARVAECNQAVAEADAMALEGVFSVRLRDGHLHVGDLGLQDMRDDQALIESAEVSAFAVAPRFETTSRAKQDQADPPEQYLGIASAAHPVFRTIARLRVRGRVAAGVAGMSSDEEDEERDVTLPADGADYLLRVTGDSMVGAGILEGDLLFVRAQETARDGEIVVAHLAGEGEVVKRLRLSTDGSSAQLVSENPSYSPIFLDAETRLQGKVTGLLRDF